MATWRPSQGEGGGQETDHGRGRQGVVERRRGGPGRFLVKPLYCAGGGGLQGRGMRRGGRGGRVREDEGGSFRKESQTSGRVEDPGRVTTEKARWGLRDPVSFRHPVPPTPCSPVATVPSLLRSCPCSRRPPTPRFLSDASSLFCVEPERCRGNKIRQRVEQPAPLALPAN